MTELLPAWLASGMQAASLIVAAVIVAVVCGLLAFAFRRREGLPEVLGFWGVVCSTVLALPVAAMGLSGSQSLVPESLNWHLPLGMFTIGADALSSIFLLPLLILGPLAALHSRGYLKGHGHGGATGVYWLFFNLLFASMILVLCACDGVLFLLAWELMGVSSFALVVFNHKDDLARSAAWKYLVAAHIGTAFLMAMFILLGPDSVESSPESNGGEWLWAGIGNTYGFAQIALAPHAGFAAVAIFILALAGFGLKAGFVPFHVWLPEAHPAAPAPVSALMSGVMIKLGIYGILRVMSLMGPPCAWWGWTFIIVGAATGLYGVICALSQSDLKRLLAYSSIENMGIVALGLGIGVYGLSCDQLAIGLLGFAGAFTHILNHSAMKGLLFLSAGAVMKGTGTLEMEKLGGLMKRMPWTGSGFIIGSAAISGLPPFNGFIGEFMILLAAFEGILSGVSVMAVPSVVALGALSLIGGLAPAVFAKAAGTVFLGEPRSAMARDAKEAPPSMIASQMTLAALCIGLSVMAPRIVAASVPAIAGASGFQDWELSRGAIVALKPLFMIGIVSSSLLVLLAVVALLRGRLPRVDVERHGPTWDCGYAEPTAKMQYTGSSLTQPLRDIFRFLFRPTESQALPSGSFPRKNGAYSSILPDIAERWLVEPIFKSVNWACWKLHTLQSGYLHVYIVLIMAALALMLLWAWTQLGGAS